MHGYEEYSSCTVRSKPYIEMKRPHKGHRVDSRGQRAWWMQLNRTISKRRHDINGLFLCMRLLEHEIKYESLKMFETHIKSAWIKNLHDRSAVPGFNPFFLAFLVWDRNKSLMDRTSSSSFVECSSPASSVLWFLSSELARFRMTWTVISSIGNVWQWRGAGPESGEGGSCGVRTIFFGLDFLRLVEEVLTGALPPPHLIADESPVVVVAFLPPTGVTVLVMVTPGRERSWLKSVSAAMTVTLGYGIFKGAWKKAAWLVMRIEFI